MSAINATPLPQTRPWARIARQMLRPESVPESIFDDSAADSAAQSTGQSADQSALPLERRALSRLIEVPWRVSATEAGDYIETSCDFVALAQAQRWHAILARLRQLDQTRAPTASGGRLYEVALNAVLFPSLDDADPIARHLALTAALPVLEAMHKTHAQDYVAAVLLARALIVLGWQARGGEDGRPGPKALKKSASYFARAEALIERFDPIEENSPMLAGARYRLAPGVDGGAEFLRDWFEDWADLDPTDTDMLSLHGRYLSPQRFGSYRELDREARRAMARAENGPATYALFWVMPLSQREAMRWLDAKLFLAGVEDVLTRTGSQRLANIFANLLYRVGRPHRGRVRRVTVGEARARGRLTKAFGTLIRLHLREVHQSLWLDDAAGIRRALGTAFAEELAKGARIRPGTQGLAAEFPQAG